jgi:hypothetical protein
MSPLVVVFLILAMVMAARMFGIYLGGGYVCPSCGARREDRHSDTCSWKR